LMSAIIAKVTRDRLMMRLATRHAGYAWERNMGYGTAAHWAGIDTLGLTAHHRRSFVHPVQEELALDGLPPDDAALDDAALDDVAPGEHLPDAASGLD
jgi:hypothetical protein